MGRWTRRDLVKAGLAASAGMVTGGDALGQVSGISANQNGAPMQAVALGGSNSGNLRDRLSMDYGWRFALGHANDPDKDFGFGKLRREGTFAKSGRVDGPAAVRFDDSAWKQVDLPHDWAVDMQFVNDPILVEHGGKPLGREYPETSIGWYRKQFVLPGSDTGRNISVEFDGIFRNATVFFNGHYITQNMSGYAPVAVDLTDFCNFADAASMQRVDRQKQELANATTDQARARIQSAMEVPGQNVLVVRVDATLDEGWFYEGAGIYRHVWLTKSSPIHIAQWGNYVRPDFGAVAGVASGTSMAALLISTEVANTGNDDAIARVRATILDPTGKTVATAASEPAGIDSRETRVFKLNTTLNKPKLWSLDTPNLYRAIMHVEVDGKPVDEEVTTFGVRTVIFDANRGLLLNGQPVKIKGTCNHQDHAGVGAAIPDRIQEYRVERLQWMGSNGCRTSHNPPTPEFLDACDRKGMLVMDETRMMSSNPEGLSQLERLIKRDRNHPSVIIWSLANEEPEQGNTRGARIVNTMKRLQRKLDPSRVCTTAMNNGYGGDGVSTVVDVQGFNYNDGRIDAYHRDHPLQPMVGTETASSLSTRGIFANDKTRGYMGAYDTEKPAWGNTAEEWWSFYADREWLAGGFAWTGFDYRGETTPYKWPCISSHFGILDTCGFPKDTAFYYKTWWGSEPALHLLPHWNWEGKEGQEIEVWAYCNQESVELFLNGTSLGSQPAKKNSHLVWKVKYAPGVLEARASKAGRVVLTDKRETAGPAAKIVATADRTRIAADGRDVAVINVSIMDAQGRPVPTADNKVSFALSGPATVIGVGNGDPSCHEPDHATERSAFNGLCMAIIQTRRGETGSISIAISSPGLQPATVMADSISAPLPPIV
ncbi:MAG TPA: beta-galactosidase GalA [Acidobacteriaceae bacterium]|jgi:beta-galactosidase|nr:beta-galactosidase GalA [Acidobacteriaceae bacterium]